MHPTSPAAGYPGLPEFQECLGSRFRVRVDADPGEVVELTLIEAMALASRGASPRPVPFSLVFSGPGARGLSQGSYAFEHGALGALEMFIVPIMPDEHGTRYEAIFN